MDYQGFKKRLNSSSQLAEFFLNGVDLCDDKIPHKDNIEETYGKAEDKLYKFMVKKLGGDTSKDFFKYLDLYDEVERSCFIMGIKTGIRVAISFELGDK